MPLIIFLILVVLIAMFGFWDTLSALLGSLMMIILFAAAAAGLPALRRQPVDPRLHGWRDHAGGDGRGVRFAGVNDQHRMTAPDQGHGRAQSQDAGADDQNGGRGPHAP